MDFYKVQSDGQSDRGMDNRSLLQPYETDLWIVRVR
jgi:hypothetical protein